MKRKIDLLMVDDEADFITPLAKRLGNRDFDVTVATEGKHTIKIAKKGKFDVAILDLNMPGMDGVEFMKALRKRHKFLESSS
jgi:CheY-like chemotaxis protein